MAYSYTQSDAEKQAQAALKQHNAAKPGDYSSPWQAELSEALNSILGRKGFSYDLAGDALYRQYRESYANQGRMAMLDTMGQAAALTGGYGNSYAQTVGQQTYQGYLQGLNDKIPELYRLAQDRYDRDGQALYNRYALLDSQESRSYSRYQDALGAWNQERAYLADQLNAQRGFDYGMFRDQVGDEQWQQEFDESKRRYDQEWKAQHPW